MFTKYSLIASLAAALMVANSNDVFAGGKRLGTRHHRCCCCVAVDPCVPATVAVPAAPSSVAAADSTTYRSFSVEPAATAPVYRAPAPSRMPIYMLPKTDPRKYSGGW